VPKLSGTTSGGVGSLGGGDAEQVPNGVDTHADGTHGVYLSNPTLKLVATAGQIEVHGIAAVGGIGQRRAGTGAGQHNTCRGDDGQPCPHMTNSKATEYLTADVEIIAPNGTFSG
jgi:hypothetical protein